MKATALDTNIDYVMQAKSALAAIERFNDEIEALPLKVSMCREKWRDYGAALLAQRVLMPSNQQFGQWVKEHGLDAGLAEHHEVRSNSMWVAEHWNDIVKSLHDVTSHHPTAIRQQCRDAGYEWAGETEHQKERKEKSERTKAKRKNYSWMRVVHSENAMFDLNGGAVKRALAEVSPNPDLFKPENESELRAACAALRAKRQPDILKTVIEEARSTVNESAQVRFDKAVAKATATLEGVYNTKHTALQADFEREVQKAVEARIAPEVEQERKRAREAIERNDKMMKNFLVRRDGIKQAMTKKELQMVLNCLHPDRAPEDRKEKYAEAFRIVKNLQPYVDGFYDNR